MEPNDRNRRSIGGIGEDIASDYLLNNGYTIITRNYRVGRIGEIDIIARESEYICFIEVKTRRNTFFGYPSEAVTKKKQDNIKKLAAIYMSNNKLDKSNARFDIVEIICSKNHKHNINLIRNAF